MHSVYRFPQEVEELKQYFSVDNADSRVRATVAEGVDVPFYILGSSTDSAKVAARQGLPYAFASHFAPVMLFDALEIYYKNFEPSGQLEQPYAIACVNVIAADTEDRAKKMSTSLVRMILGVLTNNIGYVQPPEGPTEELMSLMQNPAFERMLKYAFIGTKETVKQKTIDFVNETGVDEIMVVSHFYNHTDRLTSYRLFADIMKELNGSAQGVPVPNNIVVNH